MRACGSEPSSPAVTAFKETNRATHLQVHVAIRGHQVTLVFKTPLQSNPDGLAGQALQIRFRVYGLHLRNNKVS